MNLHPNTKEAYRLFHQGTLALARAEQQGIRLDIKYAEAKKTQLERRIMRLEKQFKKTDFYKHWEHSVGNRPPNIYSNAHLARFLYAIKKLEKTKTTEHASGQGSTDEETLLQFGIPELNDLLQIRKLKKVKDTYLEAFVREQVDGYIHPSFSLHLVNTYRSSSNNPNFQNIPKRDKEAMNTVRKALFPRPGHQLMEVDYGQLEVRIAACYHNDPTMLKYIETDHDMHADMAEQIFFLDSYDKTIPAHKTLRAGTKNGFVFPQFYGDYYVNCAKNLACSWGQLSPTDTWKKGDGIEMGDGHLADHFLSKKIRMKNNSGAYIPTTVKNLKVFTEHIKQIESHFWKKRFHVYAKWKEKHWLGYQRNGYVDLLTGFRCRGVMGKNSAINYPVQGAAFHCLMWSFIELDRIIQKERLDSRIIGQIHDAIILDINPDELSYLSKVIHRVTCEDLPKNWDWITTPLEVEADLAPVDASWAELEPYKLLK